jgi:hypothetical protein
VTPLALRRWRGLKVLVGDVVHHGSRAVERVHLETARRPFAVLELVPLVALPARGVHLVHDAIAKGVYGLIRVGNRLAGGAAGTLLDVVERVDSGQRPDPSPGGGDPHEGATSHSS